MSRQETETLLRHPTMRYTILLRSSQNARQENPLLYYVMSYIPLHQKSIIHVIVTRKTHEIHYGNISAIMPHPIEGYKLHLLPHHPAYATTRTEMDPPLYASPAPVPIQAKATTEVEAEAEVEAVTEAEADTEPGSSLSDSAP